MPVVQLLLRVVDLVGEALVVAEVEVGLRAVVGDVDLAVLVRAHRARIDVDVGVELLQRDLVAVAFEQRADGGGREALAERRDDAAGDEDVFDRALRVRRGCWHRVVCIVSLSVRLVRCGSPAGARMAERAHALEVLRRIDADGVAGGLDGLDPDAVLERAQLLERFGALDRRRRQRRQPQQAVSRR